MNLYNILFEANRQTKEEKKTYSKLNLAGKIDYQQRLKSDLGDSDYFNAESNLKPNAETMKYFPLKTGEVRDRIERQKYLSVLENGIRNHNPNFFIHFTNHEGELTPYLGAKWNTPYGIYGYPINGSRIIEQASNGTLPYGPRFKFIKFFRLKNYDKLLIMDSYTWDDYKIDKEKIINLFNETKNHFIKYENDFNTKEEKRYSYEGKTQSIQNPAQILLFTINSFFKEKYQDKYIEKGKIRKNEKDINYVNLNSHIFGVSKTLQQLGYIGLCDLGNQFIGREYSQAVIFSSKYIEVLDEVKNPFLKHIISRDENKFYLENKPSLNYNKKVILQHETALKENPSLISGKIVDIKQNHEKISIKIKITIIDQYDDNHKIDEKANEEIKEYLINYINNANQYKLQQQIKPFLHLIMADNRLKNFLDKIKIENFYAKDLTYELNLYFRE